MHSLWMFFGGAVCGATAYGIFVGRLKAEFQKVHTKLDAIFKRV